MSTLNIVQQRPHGVPNTTHDELEVERMVRHHPVDRVGATFIQLHDVSVPVIKLQAYQHMTPSNGTRPRWAPLERELAPRTGHGESW